MTNEEAIKFLSQIKDALLASNSWLPSTDNPIKESFGMAINALTAQDDSKELSPTHKTLDTISRKAAIDALHGYFDGMLETDTWSPCDVCGLIEILPSAQPEPLSDAYTKAVWTWLLDYQIKAAELKGRYTPYEVLSWVANDWRKDHERSD